MSLIPFVLLAPLSGAAVAGLCRGRFRAARAVALVSSAAALVFSALLWLRFDPSRADYQHLVSRDWIPSWGSSLLLGVDALSLLPVVLTSFLLLLSVIASWGSFRQRPGVGFSAILFLETALLGVFLSIDVLLFYVFWVIALLSIGLLIAAGGGRPGARVAVRFWVFTLGASVLLLAVFLACHHIYLEQSGSPSFDRRHWVDLVLTPGVESRLFFMSVVAFAVQASVVPLHVWLPGSLRQAPAAVRAVLCAVVLKVGAYGMLRFVIPWFPRAARTYATFILIWAIVSLFYGVLTAVVDSRPVSFLTRINIVHMALILFALFTLHAQGVKEAWFLLVAHGLFMAALLLLTGTAQERTGAPNLDGLFRVMPVATGFLVFFSVAAVLLPVAVLYRAGGASVPVQAVAAAVGVLLTAVGFFRIGVRVFRRPSSLEKNDLGRREGLVFLSLALVLLWLTIRPAGILHPLESAVDGWVSRVSGATLLKE